MTDTVADTPHHNQIRYNSPQFATIAESGRPLGLPGSVAQKMTIHDIRNGHGIGRPLGLHGSVA